MRVAYVTAGAAGMYDFIALSDIAGRLEQYCLSILQRGTDPADDDLAKIAECIESLRRQVRTDNEYEEIARPSDEQL